MTGWRPLSLLVALVLASGCSGGTTPEAGEDSSAASGRSPTGSAVPEPSAASSDSPRSSVSAGHTGDGITAEEAKKRGTFTARYDAYLAVDDLAGDKASLRLANVGQRADSYAVTLTPAGGSVVPAAVRLPAGGETTLQVDLDGPAELVVFSEGRDAEIAAVSLSDRPER